MVVDVVAFGGDFARADVQVKRIMGRIRDTLRKEMSNGALDGFLAGGDLILAEQTAFTIGEIEAGWIAEGATGFTATVDVPIR